MIRIAICLAAILLATNGAEADCWANMFNQETDWAKREAVCRNLLAPQPAPRCPRGELVTRQDGTPACAMKLLQPEKARSHD